MIIVILYVITRGSLAIIGKNILLFLEIGVTIDLIEEPEEEPEESGSGTTSAKLTIIPKWLVYDDPVGWL